MNKEEILSENPLIRIINDDCLVVLKSIADNSIDCVITDPPAGIGFMGKEWDDFGKGLSARDKFIGWLQKIAEECLRVLKPGGHALVWALPRTSHWTATAWENAGFEVRDRIIYVSSKKDLINDFLETLTEEQKKMFFLIMDESRVEHCFGSGFPKSLNIGKMIDKLGGEEGIKIRNEIRNKIKEFIIKSGKTDKEIAEICGVSTALVRFWRLGERNIQKKEAEKLKITLNNLIPQEIERKVVGIQKNAMSGWSMDGKTKFKDREITIGTSEWEGWGTALKPAVEDWWLLRKPLSEKTVAENVLKWGVGGLNIDACRIEYQNEQDKKEGQSARPSKTKDTMFPLGGFDRSQRDNLQGRFPSHLIIDDSEEVKSLFPNTKSGNLNVGHKRGKTEFYGGGFIQKNYGGDSGSASRFFYCAKASRKERDMGLDKMEARRIKGRDEGQDARDVPYKIRTTPLRNYHPTVKPLALMEYLVKLICPPNGVVLDPFMGSGTTGMACVNLGKGFIGIEVEEEYYEIAKRRIEYCLNGRLL